MSVLKKILEPLKKCLEMSRKLYKHLGSCHSWLRLLQGADEAAPMNKWTSGCPLQKCQTFLNLRPKVVSGFENLGRLSQNRATATG